MNQEIVPVRVGDRVRERWTDNPRTGVVIHFVDWTCIVVKWNEGERPGDDFGCAGDDIEPIDPRLGY